MAMVSASYIYSIMSSSSFTHNSLPSFVTMVDTFVTYLLHLLLTISLYIIFRLFRKSTENLPPGSNGWPVLGERVALALLGFRTSSSTRWRITATRYSEPRCWAKSSWYYVVRRATSLSSATTTNFSPLGCHNLFRRWFYRMMGRIATMNLSPYSTASNRPPSITRR